MREIILQNGLKALVDIEDYDRCSGYSWHIRKSKGNMGYVSNNDGVSLGNFILSYYDKTEGLVVSYKDGNKLNCRKENLIKTTRKNSNYLSKGRKNSSSKYKGVYYNKRNNKWTAKISVDGKSKFIGDFMDEDTAGLAYNEYALLYFGEYAYQNIIGADNSVDSVSLAYSQPRTVVNNSKSGYRGVIKMGSKYRARITIDGNKVHLGMFDSPIEAARAYDAKAIELHGNKSRLNFPSKESNGG